MIKRFTFAVIAAVVVASLGTVVLTIGARSPYTHANLFTQLDPRYTRTEQAVVGVPELHRGPGVSGSEAGAMDLVARGKAHLVGRGCAACHGLEGRGGVVGPPIVGSDADDLRAKTNKGPGGMPAYEPLPDAELDAIAAFLRSLVSMKGG